jgi:hypothetical protein
MNEAALPVKRIADFPLEESAKLIRRPAFWWVFIVAIAVIGVVVTFSATTLEGGVPWIVVGFLAIIVLGYTRVVDLLDEARKARDEKYASYLASVRLDLLKAVAASPEFDQATKDAVIKYLSAVHPGWSLT